MITTKNVITLLIALVGLLFFATSDAPVGSPLVPEPTIERVQIGPDHIYQDMGCTVIYASDGENAYGGNNEDYLNPFTMAWFLPSEDRAYGRVYFGYEGFLWGGGMNDQGLFFDALAIDQPMSVLQGDKPSYGGSLPDKAMAECGTVECVVELFSQYHTYDTWYHQFMFGDANGNSVIIEPNQFIRSQENYQVATNFYQSMTYIPTCNTCTRYYTAVGMFDDAPEISVELMRDILDAVHIEEGSPTLYSNVYDLKAGTIYLYHYHDYDHVVVFNVEEELAKGYHSYLLADLFPENEAFLSWAQPKRDRLEVIRATYPDIEVDPGLYDAFLGDYKVPAEMGLPYPFYSIAYENGIFFLKMKPDKAWLTLLPISENSFYHVSSFNQFEVTFLRDENDQVNQFQYKENNAVYTFHRMVEGDPELSTPPPTAPSSPPSVTPTVIPTSTVEPEKPSATAIQITDTQVALEPTQVAAIEEPGYKSNWWVYPLLGVILFAGWYLYRRWGG